MYKDGYVLSLIHGGRPARELDGKVVVPFDSEYDVLLKNKTDVDCLVELSIDGTLVSDSEFVLRAKESMNIERFVIGSLSYGQRFKFVPVNDSRVQDPTSCENGIVEARFFRRLQQPLKFTTFNPCRCRGTGVDATSTQWVYYETDTTGNWPANITFTTSSTPNDMVKCSSAGATVGGSDSYQQFTEVSGFETESIPTVLKLKIVGPASNVVRDGGPSRYCRRCGERRRKRDRYCGRCGIYLD